jgi:2-iminoacetate synthase
MTHQPSSRLIPDGLDIHSLVSVHGQAERDIQDILARARRGLRPALEEAAILLNIHESRLLTELYDTARQVKEKVFGKRIVLFAPLYISNFCNNNCLYCGFRRANREADRMSLTIREIVRQAQFLANRGYHRILLVAGEDPDSASVEYLCTAVTEIYRHTAIRIVHVNAAPMSVPDFSKLKTCGAGVYQCFQETYHRATYKRMHPSGPKHDYDWRYTAMDRAVKGGFDDIGMGALLGLYDYRFEVLSLIHHARILEQQHGAGPHTVSVPRLKPAQGAVVTQAPSPVSDQEFMKIVAVYRLALPYAGVVVSTREGPELRNQVLHVGASQISAGSRTDIGGYAPSDEHETTAQFSLSDSRSLDQTIDTIIEQGLLPSLCTACYRIGRTGEHFQSLAQAGKIKDFCCANALLSLMEYLQHNTEGETKIRGLATIRETLSGLPDSRLRQRVEEGMERIMRGEQDVHV